MTDRQLLELAAKAAGVQGHFVKNCPEDGAPKYSCGIGNAGRITPLWNPLTDDGDALRLAVKLKIDLHFEDQPNWIGELVEAFSPENEDGSRHCEAHALNPDPEASVRRAIVRAAAALADAGGRDADD